MVIRMLVVVLLVMFVWEARTTRAQISPSQCKEEKRLITNACKPVIFGRDPSPACCERVRVTHVECICPVLSSKLVALIGSVEHRIKQIEDCGRPVPRNFKCGSITTPP